ncbi:MAG: hypothetical protein ACO3AV_03710 [Ilumatobacteraceae bacterium]
MASRSLGRLAARLVQQSRPDLVRARATEFADRIKAEYRAGLEGTDATPADEDAIESEASAVVAAMREVDWEKVRAVTSEKSSEAARAMKEMSAQVDWSKVQPVAASISSALIAAVASGQLPIGGVLGGRVLRTIINEADLAARVGQAFTPPTE